MARLVAERCGTDHRNCGAGRRRRRFALLMDHFDEPFADTSALPTFLLARAAREHVKVALTGDGGDESFAGYTAYLRQAQLRGGRLDSRLARLVTDVPGAGRPTLVDQGGSWAPRTLARSAQRRAAVGGAFRLARRRRSRRAVLRRDHR
ncbi:MAG: hypothetical protein IPH48_01275 [bacterium]|nr:hypothetical protein [bacterium]